jgi:hypothetical protein
LRLASGSGLFIGLFMFGPSHRGLSPRLQRTHDGRTQPAQPTPGS